VLLGYVYYDGLELMVKWWERDEYSHGYMIPMVSLYIIWQLQDKLPASVDKGSWLAVPLMVVALFGFFLGELSAIYTIIQYSFLLALYAILLAFFGRKTIGLIWVALVYLIFMIPLPNFIYNNLSGQLQLISSSLGVFVIRLFDISVYLEGNVIDLGVYKLQVVEACSGLRYLFPLASFGFLIAYLYNGPKWQKAILFLSTIPITVLMNSFRIGVIGVTVEYWGIEMAEGFLHDFEGWVIFVGCLGVLFVEMWIFHLMAKDDIPVMSRLNLDGPETGISLSDFNINVKNQKPFIVSLILLAIVAAILPSMENRETIIPERANFNTFPLYYQGWQGRELTIEENVLAELKLTDYIQTNYINRDTGGFANFYVAYYDSQTKGASIHSPKSCLPGGGWQLTGIKLSEIEGVKNLQGEALVANRAVMRKGEAVQIVYYWFEQRGRIITNEYMAKWYLFWDSITQNRTDGALIRVVVAAKDASMIDDADRQAQRFIKDFYSLLPEYIPGKDIN
jgi:exosortase D (VPLPA-CTERM-specific)